MPPHNTPSFICFDMWGTLTEGGGQQQMNELQQILRADHVDKKIFLAQVEKNLLTHPWSLQDGIRSLSRALHLHVDKTTLEQGYRSWWGHVQNSKPFEETEEVLQVLKNNNYHMAIISNTDVPAFQFKMNVLGWNRYFEHVFLSAEIGELKPHRKVFQTVEKTLRVPQEHLLMIDDSLYHGVIPARKRNWKALWVARGKTGKDPGRIEDLRGVVSYLQR